MQAAWPKQVQRADGKVASQGDLGFHQGVPQALVAPKQQARQQMQQPAENSRPNPPMAFAATNQKAYKEMMALAREAQQ